MSADMQVYIFYRAEGWYPVECKDDADAKRHAELNPGTQKVEGREGRVVWRQQ